MLQRKFTRMEEKRIAVFTATFMAEKTENKNSCACFLVYVLSPFHTISNRMTCWHSVSVSRPSIDLVYARVHRVILRVASARPEIWSKKENVEVRIFIHRSLFVWRLFLLQLFFQPSYVAPQGLARVRGWYL